MPKLQMKMQNKGKRQKLAVASTIDVPVFVREIGFDKNAFRLLNIEECLQIKLLY